MATRDVSAVLAQVEHTLTRDEGQKLLVPDRHQPLRQTPGLSTPTVFVGVHRGRWLETLPVPMCVSFRTMEKYRRTGDAHPRAFGPWMLDSGAYTEITTYGAWRYDPDLFGATVTRILDNVATPPRFCAPQDMPCEPAARSASGLTVADHQQLTTESVRYLRSEFPFVPWIPVIQGWELAQYVEHVTMYLDAGIDLTAEPLVGVGSICRRGQIAQVVDIITTLHSMGLSLHAFGIHRNALRRCAGQLASMDSMAWSQTGRWRETAMPGCSHPGPCNNCPAFALRWHDSTSRLAVASSTPTSTSRAATAAQTVATRTERPSDPRSPSPS